MTKVRTYELLFLTVAVVCLALFVTGAMKSRVEDLDIFQKEATE